MVSRSLLYLLFLATAVTGLRGQSPGDVGAWDTVSVPAMKTSIYVGSVTLTTSAFRREGAKFEATYEATVWPWFFWNETGRITITLPPAELARLARGERIEFTGDAVNHKGKPRHVTGRADRSDAATGKIKVRIGVDDTELIFNGSYRLGP